MNGEQAWQAAVGQLQMELSKATFDTWVRDARFASFADGTFTISVLNGYARDWLESRLASTARRILTGVWGSPVEVRFVVGRSLSTDEPPPAAEPVVVAPSSPRPAGPNLNPRYTFATFVVGNSNRLAHAASLAVAENPAQAYNPLFLYGGVGMGKTHLLHAIANLGVSRGLEVLYVTSEDFTNDLINAIRAHTTDAFREKYRRMDVLLIDDIQFIAGKESTQEEFFHTFNALHGQNRQIVLSSDRPPKAMVTLEERLRSRFEWGLIADIQPPDIETKVAILCKKAEVYNIALSNEVGLFLAAQLGSNIRELEGSLIRLLAMSSLSGHELNENLAEEVLRDLLGSNGKVTKEGILKKVSLEFGFSEEEIKGTKRTQKLALARQVSMYLIRSFLNLSLTEIGEFFRGKDHSTVIYAIEKVEQLKTADQEFAQKVMRITNQINGE